jgi:nucleoside-diphosphate-sugar epimerase
MKKRGQISVLGCGWLGLELSQALIEEGFTIKGSTTSKEKLEVLKHKAVYPYLIQLNENGVLGDISDFLEGSDLIIINVPPGLRRNPHKNHVQEIAQLIPYIEQQKVPRVIFVSSTSVFEDGIDFPEIKNDTAPDATAISAKQLINVENILRSQSSFSCQIIRPAGLFAADRHPGKYLAGKTGLKNPEAPINLVHRQDLIQCLLKLIDSSHLSVTVNAAYPDHPSRVHYYTNYCQTQQLSPPVFDATTTSKGKRINAKDTEDLLGMRFRFRP